MSIVVILVDTVLNHVKQVHSFRILLTSPRKGVVVEYQQMSEVTTLGCSLSWLLAEETYLSETLILT